MQTMRLVNFLTYFLWTTGGGKIYIPVGYHSHIIPLIWILLMIFPASVATILEPNKVFLHTPFQSQMKSSCIRPFGARWSLPAYALSEPDEVFLHTQLPSETLLNDFFFSLFNGILTSMAYLKPKPSSLMSSSGAL